MSSLALLRSRNFLPLFVTQALGAINDNLFKNALVVLALYRLAHSGPILVALAGGVFILPYAIFSGLAGQLADSLEKSRAIRFTKFWELGLMVLAGIGFLTGSFIVLMLVLFGLGCQATFFSPLKYGILPDHLRSDELVAGNGLIEAGTFIGIVTGTVAGGILVSVKSGLIAASAAVLAVALAGLACAYKIPPAPAGAPDLRPDWNLPRETWGLLQQAWRDPPIWFCILAISWFWTVGAALLAEFPTIAKDSLHADAHVVTLMLGGFAVGVGIGSLACARLLHNQISLRYVAYAGFGVSLFTADFAIGALYAGHLPTAAAMLHSFTGWHMLLDLLILAIFGGVYSVPLYVMVQERSPPSHRARMIAANNVMNAFASVIGAGLTALLYAVGLSGSVILLMFAASNVAVSLWIMWSLKRRADLADGPPPAARSR